MQEKSFNIRKQSFHPIRFCTIKSPGAYSQNFLRIIFHNFVENMFSRHIFGRKSGNILLEVIKILVICILLFKNR
jgi:hypothetical protein